MKEWSMKKQYNVVVTERKSVARSKRLRESGQSSSGTVLSVLGGGGEIVVTGSAALEMDITSNAVKTGHIEPNQILPKGMTLTQFVKALLFKPVPATLEIQVSTGDKVEYGTAKGQLTYVATRNGNGVMSKGYYDNDEKNLLEFSVENNGVQTAVRKLTGSYAQAETYKATVVYAASDDESIPETTLNKSVTVNVYRKWFAGVVDSIPTMSTQVRALSASGLFDGSSYGFTISNYRTFVICVPSGTIKDVSLEGRYQYNFMDLDSAANPQKISVEGANGSAAIEYTMYIFTTTTASTETDKFTFKMN